MLAGQHQVENHEIHGVLGQERIHGFAAVDAIHDEPLLGEIRFRQLTDFRIVVNDEQPG